MSPEDAVKELAIEHRSSPVTENPDGSWSWADRTFDNEEDAYEARRQWRVLTFGIVYGGGSDRE